MVKPSSTEPVTLPVTEPRVLPLREERLGALEPGVATEDLEGVAALAGDLARTGVGVATGESKSEGSLRMELPWKVTTEEGLIPVGELLPFILDLMVPKV